MSKEKKLRIGNKDDIQKVIQYERDRGYDRKTNTQHKLHEYEIEYEIIYHDDSKIEDVMYVEAFNTKQAENNAYDILDEDDSDYSEDFEIYSIYDLGEINE